MYSANRIKLYGLTLAKLQKESNKKTINCGQKNKISSQTNILKQKLKPDRRVNENTRNKKEVF
jgi:hypothetical protein